MNSMKKRYVVFSIVCTLALAVAAVASLVYDYCSNGNCVTTISGLWSALATIAVGLIAFWQSRRYKELSDETNEAMIMPEVYQTTAFSDEFQAPFEEYRAYVKGEFDKAENCMVSKPIHLSFVRGPIINITVKDIGNSSKVLSYSQTSTVSLRDETIPFNLVLSVPEEWMADGKAKLTATLSYENIYGIKYEKRIRVSLCLPDLAADSIEFEKAVRVTNRLL